MNALGNFVDIHCHLIPGIDDGAKTWDESLAMAEIAVSDGVRTVVVTPHQLGTYPHNSGDTIRQLTGELQRTLDDHDIPLEVLPGADVRIEEDMIQRLCDGRVLTLGDHGRHVLLELPHELYFSLDHVLAGLRRVSMVGILSHPERNQGLLKRPALVGELVDQGCLMQVTAGSLLGTFGPQSQSMTEWMLSEGLVHFLATDAHGSNARRPLIRRAFERVAEMIDEPTALDLCCLHPAAVADDEEVPKGRRLRKKRSLANWFNWRKAG